VAKWLTASGLALDILGVLVLSWGASAYWRSGREQLTMTKATFKREKLGSTVGLCLIVGGFILQLIGALL
jgi:hypothetical protein